MTSPDTPPTLPDIDAVEALVRRAIDERKPELLASIGQGEFSIATRWGSGDDACVVKRVPPFLNRTEADRYVALVQESIHDFRARGVRCVTTELLVHDRSDGSAVVYHCQPLLDPATLADNVLRTGVPNPEEPVMLAVIDSVVRVVGDRYPMDAQFANWAWVDDEPWQLDFSTPLMLDASGAIRFDPRGFQREYPAVTRALVLKELMKLAPRFSDVEFVLTDLLVQLIRGNLRQWCGPVVEAAKVRHGIDLSIERAQKQFDDDAKFFPTLLRIKRVQRAWMQRTGRRYDTLLPATTSFGK